MTDTQSVETSNDAYRLIHMSLAGWLEGALENGFEIDPIGPSVEASPVDEYMLMAAKMREIEGHTEIISTPSPDDLKPLPPAPKEGE